MEPGPELRYARTADGVTLAHQVLGSGPPLVWLPSLGNLVGQWRVPALRRAYERLAGAHTLVLYDGRGMGSSDRRVDVEDLGVYAHLRDLHGVLDATGLGRANLLGYYHSVTTALAFAADHPERVGRMVLFGGAPRLRDAMGPAQTQALLSLVDQDWDLFAESAAHAWLGWSAGEDGRLVAESFRTAASPAVARAWFTAAAAADVTDRLPRVVAPTLVLHRQGERQMPEEVSRRLADALPNGAVRVLPGVTPTLFVDDGADVDLVSRFLRTGLLAPPPRPPGGGVDGVTARELDVLRRVAAGDSNAQIARRLGIAVHTVERHTANLYRKIGARGRADAAAYAVRRGIV